MISVLIAESQELTRLGIRSLLVQQYADALLADEVGSHAELKTQLNERRYDLLIVELFLTGAAGIDGLQAVKDAYPDMAIITLSKINDEHIAIRCINAGASGVVCKNKPAEHLLKAVEAALAGKVYTSTSLNELLGKGRHEKLDETRSLTLLSSREMQILALIIDGVRITDIASELNVSVKTISTHKSRAFAKLGIESNSQLFKFMLEQNRHGTAVKP